MAESHYFLATLYRFNDEARKQVILRFNDTMNDIAARCWYDANLDMFEIKAPRDIGSLADERLMHVVSKYVVDELAAAERDERLPNVERSADSSFDDGLSHETAEHSRVRSLESVLSASSTPWPRQLTVHLINTEQSSSELRLFRLPELPEGLLERVLANPSGPTETKLIASGFTCRAVRTSGPGGRDQVFNGRLGQPLPLISQADEDAFLATAPFHTLIGNAAIAEIEPEMRRWRFEEGHEVTVQQWIAGMGKVELYDPDARPEVPKDAKKMLVVDRNPGLGRVRVPKGAPALTTDVDDESSSDEPAGAKKLDFNQLLNVTATGDSDSEDSDCVSQTSGDSEATTKDKNVSFRSLLVDSRAEGKQGSSHSPSANNEGTRKAWKAPLATAVTIHSEHATSSPHIPTEEHAANVSGCVSDETEEALRSGQWHLELDSYGKEWAAVDSIGLTAKPDSQARWQLENASPRKKPRKSGIQLAVRPFQILSPQPTDGSVPMSLSSGRDFQRLEPLPTPSSMATESTARATVSNIAAVDAHPAKAPWENKIVQARVPHGRLVDDTAPPSSGTPLRRPPGLPPSPGSQRDQRTLTQQRQSSSQGDGMLVSTETGQIHDLPSHARPPPGFTSKPMRPQIAANEQPLARQQAKDSGAIVERIQPRVDESVRKRYTMRQKAQKKGKVKGGKTNQGKAKAELPLPDPVPPPKKSSKEKGCESQPQAQPQPYANSPKRKASAPNEADAGKRSKTQAPPATNNDAGAHNPCKQPDDAQPAHLAELQGLISAARSSHPSLLLEVQFGMILFSCVDKALRNGGFRATSFKTEAVEAAELYSRLTTSTGEAKHVLEIIRDASPTYPRSLYEFHLRGGDGILRKFTCGSDGDLLAVDAEKIVGNAYMHFPYRMWDAQYVIKTPIKIFAKEAVERLLASLTTAVEAPSFYAKVPNADFTIEKVLAKREFSRTTEQGARIVVTEAQKLRLESLNEGMANLKAMCDARDVMIAEHRLWWEAKIEANTVDDVAVLQALVGRMLPEMDSVGLLNRGPWEPRRMEANVNVAPQMPFW